MCYVNVVMNIVKNIFCLSFLLFIVACSSSNNQTEEKVNIIQAPQWVQKNTSVNNPFSAIGLTDKKGSIKDVIKYAENNALANLKPLISVKLDGFFDNEIVQFNDDKKAEYKTRFKYIVDNVLKNMPLDKIARREAMWVSPDNDTTYVMMVIDKPFIIKYLTNEINAVEKTYKYDEEFLKLLGEVKDDVFADLTPRKRVPYSKVKNTNIYATENVDTVVNNDDLKNVNDFLIDDEQINNLIDKQN